MSFSSNPKTVLVILSALKIVDKIAEIRRRQLKERGKKMLEEKLMEQSEKLNEITKTRKVLQIISDVIGLVILIAMAFLIITELTGCVEDDDATAECPVQCENNGDQMCYDNTVYTCRNLVWLWGTECSVFEECITDGPDHAACESILDE